MCFIKNTFTAVFDDCPSMDIPRNKYTIQKAVVILKTIEKDYFTFGRSLRCRYI